MDGAHMRELAAVQFCFDRRLAIMAKATSDRAVVRGVEKG